MSSDDFFGWKLECFLNFSFIFFEFGKLDSKEKKCLENFENLMLLYSSSSKKKRDFFKDKNWVEHWLGKGIECKNGTVSDFWDF